jgi:uncharacterized protein YkwD
VRGVWNTRSAVLVAVVATVVVGLAVVAHPASAAVAAGDCSADNTWPVPRKELADGVLALVNAHRTALGLAPLRVSPSLRRSAEWKARHMARYGYLGHDDPAPPGARSWFDRIAACGFRGSAGENIAVAFRTPKTVVQAWLEHPPHRMNIEGSWTTTGIGAAVSPTGVVYWAEDFGDGTGTGGGGTAAAGSRTACVVPGVLRLGAAAAARRIRAAGCNVHTVRVHMRVLPKGVVAWQVPHRRVSVPRGAVVTLAVNAL